MEVEDSRRALGRFSRNRLQFGESGSVYGHSRPFLAIMVGFYGQTYHLVGRSLGFHLGLAPHFSSNQPSTSPSAFDPSPDLSFHPGDCHASTSFIEPTTLPPLDRAPRTSQPGLQRLDQQPPSDTTVASQIATHHEFSFPCQHTSILSHNKQGHTERNKSERT